MREGLCVYSSRMIAVLISYRKGKRPQQDMNQPEAPMQMKQQSLASQTDDGLPTSSAGRRGDNNSLSESGIMPVIIVIT